MAEPSIADREKKGLGGAQHPPQENDSSSSSAGLIEAVAVEVTDDHHRPQQVVYGFATTAPAGRRMPTNPRVRNNSSVQCCYPITVEDPVDLLRARIVASGHISLEIMAVFFCTSPIGLCGIMLFLGVLSSSVVACCCKHRMAYMLWSWCGGLLFVLHAIAAVGVVDGDSYDYISRSPVTVFLMQMLFCFVNALVAHLGRVIVTSLRERERHDPVEVQLELPVRAYPVAEVQGGEITEEDPVEMIQARNVAAWHICLEILAVFFCPTPLKLCGITLFLAVLSSSVVACCCKHRMTYMLWSWFGGLLFMLHAIAAVGPVDPYKYQIVLDSPTLVSLLQMILCAVNAIVVYLGFVITTALREREPHDPVEMQLEMPMRASVYPVAEVQGREVRRVVV